MYSEKYINIDFVVILFRVYHKYLEKFYEKPKTAPNTQLETKRQKNRLGTSLQLYKGTGIYEGTDKLTQKLYKGTEIYEYAAQTDPQSAILVYSVLKCLCHMTSPHETYC